MRQEAGRHVGSAARRQPDNELDRLGGKILRLGQGSIIALDRLTADFDLHALTYYYRGLDGNEAERLGAGLILGNSLLTARHIPASGEGDLKTCLAMLILDRFGVDAIDIGRAFNTEDSAWQPTTLADGQPAQYPAWFHPERQPDGSFIARHKDGTDIAHMPARGTFTNFGSPEYASRSANARLSAWLTVCT